MLFATSHLPADIVAASAITRIDSGPGGTYARLAELGHKPVHFREEIRSRMPSPAEAERLSLALGTPVIQIVRTAFAHGGRAVEVNDRRRRKARSDLSRGRSGSRAARP